MLLFRKMFQHGEHCYDVEQFPGRHVLWFECDGKRLSAPDPRNLVFLVTSFCLTPLDPGPEEAAAAAR